MRLRHRRAWTRTRRQRRTLLRLRGAGTAEGAPSEPVAGCADMVSTITLPPGVTVRKNTHAGQAGTPVSGRGHVHGIPAVTEGADSCPQRPTPLRPAESDLPGGTPRLLETRLPSAPYGPERFRRAPTRQQ